MSTGSFLATTPYKLIPSYFGYCSNLLGNYLKNSYNSSTFSFPKLWVWIQPVQRVEGFCSIPKLTHSVTVVSHLH